MDRDLSPSRWLAPGKMKLALRIIASALGNDPIPIDRLVSEYAVRQYELYNLAGASWTTLYIRDATHSRIAIFLAPRGFTTNIKLAGAITDAVGLTLNPAGFAILTFPDTGAPASIYAYCAVAAAGCRLIVL